MGTELVVKDEELLIILTEIRERLARIEHGMDTLVFREIAVQHPVKDEKEPPQKTQWLYA